MTVQYLVKWRNRGNGETREWECVTELEAVQVWCRAQSLTDAFPVSVTTSAMRELGVELGPEDVTVEGGAFVVDGMPLDDWAHAMSMD